jgi:hypothetical protein
MGTSLPRDVFVNTINDELSVIFVSLRIIVYSTIIGVNLPDRLDFWEGGLPAGALHDKRYMSYELNFGM